LQIIPKNTKLKCIAIYELRFNYRLPKRELERFGKKLKETLREKKSNVGKALISKNMA